MSDAIKAELSNYSNGEILRAALRVAGVVMTDEQLLLTLQHLDRTNHGVWHADDLDGG